MMKLIRVSPVRPLPIAVVNRDQAEILDPLEMMESPDHLDPTESLVAPDRMRRRPTQSRPRLTSALALPPLDPEARKDQMDLQEKMGHLEAQDPMVNLDRQVP